MEFNFNTALILITGLVSYLAFTDRVMFDRYKHFPYAEARQRQYYRLFTSMFLHADWIHLFINMYVLYIFGGIVEYYLASGYGLVKGGFLYLLIYLLTGVIANIPTMLKHKDNPTFASIGASGAVSGVVFIYILLNPWGKLLIYFVLPMYSIVAGILYLIYSSWASKNSKTNIDHDAHLYGALAGMLLMISLQPGIVQQFINQIKNAPF